jgi:hypothetical protein
MILSGKIGRWTVDLLTRFSGFNRHYKMVRFGDTYKIYQSKPLDELKKTDITTANFLSFKFEIYDAFAILKEHFAQAKELDEENNQLLVNVWDNEQMQNLVKPFTFL